MSFRERLRHDSAGAYYDGSIRYMMIRPDALMGLFARLDEDARQAALEALAHSITEHGGRSARSYVNPDEIDALTTIIAETAPQLGWGVWRFEPASEDALTVHVENSPFAEGAAFAGAVCHPIVGMLRAVGAMVFGKPCDVHEVHCANDGADRCHFRVAVAA
ncbi:MAG: V4R domain-containing protein [Pseudomonadota bacterium]